MVMFGNQPRSGYQLGHSYVGQNVVADASLSERLAFIRKVYGLLAASLVLGIVSCLITLSSPGFLSVVAKNLMLFGFAEIGVLLLASFVSQQGSMAFLLLNAFVILTGITTAPIVYFYQEVALSAALTTVACFLGLTAYTWVSKKDFSYLGSALTIVLIGMVVLSLVNIFLKSNLTQTLLAFVGVVVFCGFILFET